MVLIDTYFTEKIEEIDAECNHRKDAVAAVCKWDSSFRESVNAWPCVNFVACDKAPAAEGFTCGACGTVVTPTQDSDLVLASGKCLLQLFGQRYDQTTLRNLPPADSLPRKDYEVCLGCQDLVAIYAKVVHLKYELYTQCASRVTSMKVANPGMETTEILNNLLADEKCMHKVRSQNSFLIRFTSDLLLIFLVYSLRPYVNTLRQFTRLDVDKLTNFAKLTHVFCKLDQFRR